MYYDFSQLVQNTNTIIDLNKQLLACNWIIVSAFVVIIVLNLLGVLKNEVFLLCFSLCFFVLFCISFAIFSALLMSV